jgi:hypothetical protein
MKYFQFIDKRSIMAELEPVPVVHPLNEWVREWGLVAGEYEITRILSITQLIEQAVT